MKKRITIVHGIHTNDTAGWMDYLVCAFRDRGWEARKWTYGYAYAMLTRFQNPGRAEELTKMLRPGEIVLGHSNGGCIAWMAAERGAPIGGAILLNPALDTDKVMASQVRWVNLYPNHDDGAVGFARLFAGHPWGAQGRDGLSKFDSRYRIVYTDSPTGKRAHLPAVHGHSAVLAPEALPFWSTAFIDDAEARFA